MKKASFVQAILRSARERKPLRVVSDQTVSPTCVKDAAKIILHLVSAPVASGIYHVVNSGVTSWHAMAERILSRAGIHAEVAPVRTAEFGGRALRPSYSALSNAKVVELYGPIRSWEDALGEYLDEAEGQ